MGSVETESGHLVRIETDALVLRPFEREDAATVFALSTEPAYMRGLPSQVYADETESLGALEFLIAQFAEPADPRHGPYVLAIDHRGDDTLIGHVGLSPLKGEVEVGFAIGEAYQRRGLAVEAVDAACRWALSKFELPKILALTAHSNEGSRKVLARAGFEHQEDRVMPFQGTEQTVSVYSLLGPRP
jgi:RimJ/RimL family protein N-acetyltransferase